MERRVTPHPQANAPDSGALGLTWPWQLCSAPQRLAEGTPRRVIEWRARSMACRWRGWRRGCGRPASRGRGDARQAEYREQPGLVERGDPGDAVAAERQHLDRVRSVHPVVADRKSVV